MTDTPATPEPPEQPDGLVAKLAAIAGELHRFPKTERTSGRGAYAFAGVDAMADHLRPAMARLGVVMYPSAVEVLECREYVRDRVNDDGNAYQVVQWRTVLQVTWTVTDGAEAIPVVSTGEALDTSDKSANKAETAARKNAMKALFNISTGDDPDPDATRPGDDGPQRVGRAPAGRSGASGGAGRPAASGAPPTPPRAPEPLSPDDARKARRRHAGLAEAAGSRTAANEALAKLGVSAMRQLLDAQVWLKACEATGRDPNAALPEDPGEDPPAGGAS
jgi:hypothetical protein